MCRPVSKYESVSKIPVTFKTGLVLCINKMLQHIFPQKLINCYETSRNNGCFNINILSNRMFLLWWGFKMHRVYQLGVKVSKLNKKTCLKNIIQISSKNTWVRMSWQGVFDINIIWVSLRFSDLEQQTLLIQFAFSSQ